MAIAYRKLTIFAILMVLLVRQEVVTVKYISNKSFSKVIRLLKGILISVLIIINIIICILFLTKMVQYPKAYTITTKLRSHNRQTYTRKRRRKILTTITSTHWINQLLYSLCDMILHVSPAWYNNTVPIMVLLLGFRLNDKV